MTRRWYGWSISLIHRSEADSKFFSHIVFVARITISFSAMCPLFRDVALHHSIKLLLRHSADDECKMRWRHSDLCGWAEMQIMRCKPNRYLFRLIRVRNKEYGEKNMNKKKT